MSGREVKLRRTATRRGSVGLKNLAYFFLPHLKDLAQPFDHAQRLARSQYMHGVPSSHGTTKRRRSGVVSGFPVTGIWSPFVSFFTRSET